LPGQNLESPARLPFGQGLAQADDGPEPGRQDGLGLFIDRRARLAEELAAFAVAYYDGPGPGGRDHGDGDFAGEGALGLPMDILGGDGNGRPSDRLDRGLKTGEGDAESHVAVAGERVEPRQKVRKKFAGLAAGLVHFPVSGEQGFSLHIHLLLIESQKSVLVAAALL